MWIFACIERSVLHFFSKKYVQLFAVFNPIWCSVRADCVSKSFESLILHEWCRFWVNFVWNAEKTSGILKLTSEFILLLFDNVKSILIDENLPSFATSSEFSSRKIYEHKKVLAADFYISSIALLFLLTPLSRFLLSLCHIVHKHITLVNTCTELYALLLHCNSMFTKCFIE